MNSTIHSIAIFGVGLIGGSLALALRAQGFQAELIGYGRNRERLQRAVERGALDRWTQDLSEAAVADCIILATPVGSIEPLLRQLQPAVARGAIITDVGSTKGSVLAAAEAVFGAIPPRLIPGHPVAGKEQSGIEAAEARLFQQRLTILTPTPTSCPQALAEVKGLWELAGAEVVEMSAAQHDEVLAATSHLPHLLAFTLVDMLARLDDHDDIFRFAAGGFRDFTRIASSDPQMWHDIALSNAPALLKMIDRYQSELTELAAAIEQQRSHQLLHQFQRAKAARDRYCNTNDRKRHPSLLTPDKD